MTSPYITEAMRRRELPIRVASWSDDTFWVSVPRDAALLCGFLGKRADTPDDAKLIYIKAINELSKEG